MGMVEDGTEDGTEPFWSPDSKSVGFYAGGKVILMSSARGLLGHPAGYTAYCASKSAVDGITKALG